MTDKHGCNIEYVEDDDAFLELPTQMLGEITVEIWRIDFAMQDNVPGDHRILKNEDKVHEKSKKAIAHRVK